MEKKEKKVGLFSLSEGLINVNLNMKSKGF